MHLKMHETVTHRSVVPRNPRLSTLLAAIVASSLTNLAQATPTLLTDDSNITTLYVSTNGRDTSDCTSAASPCGTLKYAVEAVAAFMTPLTEPVPILLTAGNYTSSSCGIVSSRPLNISGGGKHDRDTVIDCEGTDRLLFTSASLWMSLLTIINGNSIGDGGGISTMFNGAMETYSVTLTDLAIVNCTSNSNGGGLAVETIVGSECGVMVTMDDVDVISNTAVGANGGGMYMNGASVGLWAVTAKECTFSWNSASIDMSYEFGNGGGLFYAVDGDNSLFSFANCTVANNSGSGFIGGGGLFAQADGDNSTISCVSCTLINNLIGGDGGGAYVVGNRANNSLSFVNCLVADNIAGGYNGGGGLFVRADGGSSTVSFGDCAMTNNAASGWGGVYAEANGVHSGVLFVNCSVLNNTGRAGGGGAFAVTNGGSSGITFEEFAVRNNTSGGSNGGGVGARVVGGDSTIHLKSCEVAHNTAIMHGTGGVSAFIGGANSSMSFVSCTIYNNSGGDHGGGLYASTDGAVGGTVTISLVNCTVTNNSAKGDGGGIAVSSSAIDLPLNNADCPQFPMYRQWASSLLININGTIVSGNAANCTLGTPCSGGGFAMFESSSNPGVLIVSNSTFQDNFASTFGGAMYIGGPSGASSSCSAVITHNTTIAHNTAERAGNQIYNNCGGNFTVSTSTLSLVASGTEVVVPLASDVSFSAGTILQCPLASKFSDAFSGLYGSSAYPANYPYPWNVTFYVNGPPCPYLTSTLQFGCVVCPPGSYSLSYGYSNGTAGSAVNPECMPCPFGGACDAFGGVVAQPGYWGSADDDGSVAFSICPSSYCCSDSMACQTVNACSGNRTGPLCGDCSPGFSESVSSTACVPSANCRSSLALFWPLAIVFVFVNAFLQLLLISNLLPDVRESFVTGLRRLAQCVKRSCCTRGKVDKSLPPRDVSVSGLSEAGLQGAGDERSASKGNGDAKFKVFSYFTQMCVYVALPVSSELSLWLNKLRSALNIDLPQASGTPSKWSQLCAYTGMTAAGKVQLSGAMPVAVGFAMVLILLLKWAVSRWLRKSDKSVDISLTEELLPPGDGVKSYGTTDSYAFDSNKSLLRQQSTESVRMRPKYIAAALNLFLTVYSSLLVTTVAMLHCVHVPGQPADVSSLFIQGSFVCDYSTWPQSMYAFVAVFLVASPLFIPIAASWAVKRHDRASQPTPLSRGRTDAPTWKDDACEGVLLAFVAPYVVAMPWWESVMMLHRLALAFLFTFASESPAIQSLLACMMCFGVAIHHVYRQPFRRPESQGLQTVLLSCLSIVALVKVFSSSQVQLATPADANIDAAIALTNTFCEVVTLLFQYLIPFTALLASYYFS